MKLDKMSIWAKRWSIIFNPQKADVMVILIFIETTLSNLDMSNILKE